VQGDAYTAGMANERSLAVQRLFIGLWPDAALREALARYQAAWQWPRGAARVSHERLHLTLHFLGDVATERVPALSLGLDAVALQPFTLQWERPEVWNGGIAVLRPAACEGLHALHGSVGRVLAQQGFALERRGFKPHLTLARKAVGAVPPVEQQLPAWPVRDFVLVASQAGYRVLSRHQNRSDSA
jgi:2'-5' RNA ligase